MTTTHPKAILTSIEDRLQRFAARYQSQKSTVSDLDQLVSALMNQNYYFEEFTCLDDDELNFEEKAPFIRSFLDRLEWSPLSEKSEFIFMTGLYATVGSRDNTLGYYAICEWMNDVGEWLDNLVSTHYFGDAIGADKIYGGFYSACKYTGYDLIPGVSDPKLVNWEDQLGDFCPVAVFEEWLKLYPDWQKHEPVNIGKLNEYRVTPR
jgi:hypothetical protein